MTDTVIEPSDEKLLLRSREEPGLLDRLKREAQAAYLVGRTRVGDYQAVDAVWSDLRNTWMRNRNISDAVSPNCSADNQARADDLRATIKVLEYMKGLTGEGLEKPVPAVPTGLLAQRLSGVFDSPLETAFAAMPAPEPNATDGLPKTFTPNPHGDGKRRQSYRRVQ